MKTKQIQNFIKVFILNRLYLLKIAELNLPQHMKNEFDDLYENFIATGEGNFISYNSDYPIHLFLNYIIENKNVLVHGSNNAMISIFEPKESSLFNGKPVKAVFASTDGVWSLFFAVKSRSGYIGSLRNLCITTPTKKGIRRFYYFSVNDSNIGDYWTNGTIYFLPKNLFKQGGIKDEWVCEQKVIPLARLSVTPNDFPFLDKVRKHKETDSSLKTIIKAFLTPS